MAGSHRVTGKEEEGVMQKFSRRTRNGFALALIVLTGWCCAAWAEAPASDAGDWIGVKVKSLSESLRSQWDYQGSGVLVTAVTPGSPADHAGLQPGDVLVALGSVSLWGDEDVAAAKQRITLGQQVSAVVTRNNGHMIKIVNLETVAEKPAVEAPRAVAAPVETATRAPGPADAAATAPAAATTPAPDAITGSGSATPAPAGALTAPAPPAATETA